VAHFADGIDLPIRPFGAPDVHPAHWWFTPRRADPTGIGGALPGFGDQRELELLVEARFTPLRPFTFSARTVRIGSENQTKSARLHRACRRI